MNSPGPWTIDEDGRTIKDSLGQNVGGCVVKRMSPEDARLIAASPELLKSLEMLSSHNWYEARKNGAAWAVTAWCKAKSAIANAQHRTTRVNV